jgi:hypothetical protein
MLSVSLDCPFLISPSVFSMFIYHMCEVIIKKKKTENVNIKNMKPADHLKNCFASFRTMFFYKIRQQDLKNNIPLPPKKLMFIP